MPFPSLTDIFQYNPELIQRLLGDANNTASNMGGTTGSVLNGAVNGSKMGTTMSPGWGTLGGAAGGALMGFLNRNNNQETPSAPGAIVAGMTKGLDPNLLYGLYPSLQRSGFRSMLGQYLR